MISASGRSTPSFMSDRIERIPKSRIAEEPLAGKIAVMCWCEKTMWHVPIEWVMAGKAPSCGPKCMEAK